MSLLWHSYTLVIMIVILALLTPRSLSHFSFMPSRSFTVNAWWWYGTIWAQVYILLCAVISIWSSRFIWCHWLKFLSGWVALESSVGVTGYVEIYFRRIMHKSCHQPSATGDFQRTVLIVVLWYPKTSTRQLQAIIQRIPTCSQLEWHPAMCTSLDSIEVPRLEYPPGSTHNG